MALLVFSPLERKTKSLENQTVERTSQPPSQLTYLWTWSLDSWKNQLLTCGQLAIRPFLYFRMLWKNPLLIWYWRYAYSFVALPKLKYSSCSNWKDATLQNCWMTTKKWTEVTSTWMTTITVQSRKVKAKRVPPSQGKVLLRMLTWNFEIKLRKLFAQVGFNLQQRMALKAKNY